MPDDQNPNQNENLNPKPDETPEGNDDNAGLKSALDKEREARKTADKELKKLQTRLAELEGKDKSDVERLTGERDKLTEDLKDRETRLRTLTASEKIHSAATKANAIEPAAVFKLVRDELTYDDDGQPTNVAEAVAEAKKQFPAMFQASPGSGDGGKGSNGIKGDPIALANAGIRQLAGRG